MKNLMIALFLLAGTWACQSGTQQQDTTEAVPEALMEMSSNPGEALVLEMVNASGGIEMLKSLNDVEYEYVYDAVTAGKKDVSIERYVFDGEYSWAEYTTREMYAFPKMEGKLIMGYDGNEAWCTIDGTVQEDSAMNKLADFMRKTNYYWFTMPFKLLDDGINYEHQGKKTIGEAEYEVVKISYGEGVGDVQDTYVLYLNPETKLLDAFLFTVMDFGMADPLLMFVEYQEVDGVKVPAFRKYAKADWDGNILEDKWVENHFRNVKFNNGFTRDMFKKPASQS